MTKIGLLSYMFPFIHKKVTNFVILSNKLTSAELGTYVYFFQMLRTVHLIFTWGGLGFLVRAKTFFGQNQSKIIFSPVLWAGLLFFFS